MARKEGKFGARGLVLLVGGAAMVLSGCAYKNLPESTKGVVRNTPGILWPAHWRKPAKEDTGETVRRDRLPENVYERADGKLWPKPGYKWKTRKNGDYDVVPIN
ncbi:hypothetical protein GOV13_01835 [Candidatus Pacearchaeota archaeon]|nr:hypothetical protein [Candidatus Pacearchaeota archaeon]